MSGKNTGGPAFPCDEMVVRSELTKASQGMTLRDYLAAHTKPIEDMGVTVAESITGLKLPIRDHYKDEADFWVDSIGFWAMANAKYRFMQADAMLKAREA